MKKIKIVPIVFSMLLISYTAAIVNAQDNLGARIILGTNEVKNVKYHVYNPPFHAKIIYGDTIEAANKFPEQLMSSMISVKNQAWVDYNTLGGAEESSKIKLEEFDKSKSFSKDNHYMELLSKLEFEVNGDKMAIIKFYLHSEDREKPVAGATVMQYVGNRWYETSKPYTTTMAMAIMVFKTDVMTSLLTGESENELVSKLIKKVFDNGLNFDKLLEQQDLTDEEKAAFTNPLNW